MTTGVWDPQQYERFASERSQPFFDLMGLIEPVPRMRAVDLGCGTGKLTVRLHEHLGALSTLGVDSSAAMLADAERHLRPGATVSFELADVSGFAGGPFDLVFSNAALHWLPDQEAAVRRVAGLVAPSGQLAVQVPANFDHPSHTVAAQLAKEPPFRDAMGGYSGPRGVLAPEAYSRLLDQLGFRRQHVRLQVYSHHLPSRDEVIEWVKGTLLTDYQGRLSEPMFAEFLAAYRARLLPLLDDTRPFHYPFKRILFWGRR